VTRDATDLRKKLRIEMRKDLNVVQTEGFYDE